MRAYRKRSWAAMAVNLTPLIDVVFLIIIFFIIMINFSEMHIRRVNLPKADQTRESQVDKRLKVPIVIKSEDLILLKRKKIDIAILDNILRATQKNPQKITITILADETVPYSAIKEVMHKVSQAGISKIEFSTLKDRPDPLEEDQSDET